MVSTDSIRRDIRWNIAWYCIVQYTKICMLSAHVQPGQHVALASATGVCAGLASCCDSLFLIVVWFHMRNEWTKGRGGGSTIGLSSVTINVLRLKLNSKFETCRNFEELYSARTQEEIATNCDPIGQPDSFQPATSLSRCVLSRLFSLLFSQLALLLQTLGLP